MYIARDMVKPCALYRLNHGCGLHGFSTRNELRYYKLRGDQMSRLQGVSRRHDYGSGI